MKTLKKIIKKNIKKFLGTVKNFTNPPLKDFSNSKIPWIDKDGISIETFLNDHSQDENIGYDLKKKLTFWRKNGYVILENVVSEKLIDKFLHDLENFLNNHKKFKSEICIELPNYQKNRIQSVRDVPLKILNGKYIKILDFHNKSRAGKELMLHRAILYFLETIFQENIVGMQSLTFKYGSQQPAHQDFAFVKPGEPSHLAASWLALEDIHNDSGPLFYYKGSHKIKKFNFGNGILYKSGKSTKSTGDFVEHLLRECKNENLERKKLLIKKGDILIWHSALVHGGEAIINEKLTRKSFVCHYSKNSTYRNHLLKKYNNPIYEEINGGIVYKHPIFVDEENYYD